MLFVRSKKQSSFIHNIILILEDNFKKLLLRISTDFRFYNICWYAHVRKKYCITVLNYESKMLFIRRKKRKRSTPLRIMMISLNVVKYMNAEHQVHGKGTLLRLT